MSTQAHGVLDIICVCRVELVVWLLRLASKRLIFVFISSVYLARVCRCACVCVAVALGYYLLTPSADVAVLVNRRGFDIILASFVV